MWGYDPYLSTVVYWTWMPAYDTTIKESRHQTPAVVWWVKRNSSLPCRWHFKDNVWTPAMPNLTAGLKTNGQRTMKLYIMWRYVISQSWYWINRRKCIYLSIHVSVWKSYSNLQFQDMSLPSNHYDLAAGWPIISVVTWSRQIMDTMTVWSLTLQPEEWANNRSIINDQARSRAPHLYDQ